jgi:ketosteroid isomerase-like protein
VLPVRRHALQVAQLVGRVKAARQGTGALTDVFAPDMVWRIEGHSAASKEYRSKQQFIDEVLVPFGARFTVSGPFRPVTMRAVYADDDTVNRYLGRPRDRQRRSALREQLRLDHQAR